MKKQWAAIPSHLYNLEVNKNNTEFIIIFTYVTELVQRYGIVCDAFQATQEVRHRARYYYSGSAHRTPTLSHPPEREQGARRPTHRPVTERAGGTPTPRSHPSARHRTRAGGTPTPRDHPSARHREREQGARRPPGATHQPDTKREQRACRPPRGHPSARNRTRAGGTSTPRGHPSARNRTRAGGTPTPRSRPSARHREKEQRAHRPPAATHQPDTECCW